MRRDLRYPTAENLSACVPSPVAELRFDFEQPIVFGYPFAAAGRAGFDLSSARRYG